MRLPSLAVLVGLSLVACSTHHEDPPNDAGTSGGDTPLGVDAPTAIDTGTLDAATATDTTTPRADTSTADVEARCVPTGGGPSRELIVLFDEVFAPHECGRCHDGAGGFGTSGTLVLTSAAEAQRTLVNVEGCDGVRVVPCDPEASYLSWVVRNGDGICRSRRHTFFDQLTEAEAERIDDWIRSGAR